MNPCKAHPDKVHALDMAHQFPVHNTKIRDTTPQSGIEHQNPVHNFACTCRTLMTDGDMPLVMIQCVPYWWCTALWKPCLAEQGNNVNAKTYPQATELHLA